MGDGPAALPEPRRGELDRRRLGSGELRLGDQRVSEVDDVRHRHKLPQPLWNGETAVLFGVYQPRERGAGRVQKVEKKH
jgi:hypothetical protein